MNKISWSLGIAGCLSFEAALASENTNQPPAGSTYDTNTVYVTHAELGRKFFPRFKDELTPAGQRIMYDRFDFPSRLTWVSIESSAGYSIHEYVTDYGAKTVYKIMGSAAREAAVETLPLGEYEDTGRNLGKSILGFGSRLLRGSIGNTAEEDSEKVSANTSSSSLRHIVNFEWNEPKDTWSGQYGWRPWRDNPYVYLNNNLGHAFGRQFIRTEMRCFGYLRPNSFGIIRTEASAAIALSPRSQLVLGGFAYPFEGEEKYQPQGSIRFETFWRQSILSFGVASGFNGPTYNIAAEVRF